MTSALLFSGVVKSYDDRTVLSGIDLAVETGGFFGLIGVNGAGKTTLIKALLDLTAIDAGHIDIFSTPHTEIRARESLAYLPERFVPPHHATGADFLTYMQRMYGNAADRDKCREALAAVDLDPVALAQPVRTLSKGMAQKLGLVAVLLSDRPLFVLDEPMSGLDPKARALFKQHLSQRKVRGQTLFFSTHLLPDVEALCDRIAILHGGMLRFVGTPQECCNRFDAPTLEQAYLRSVDGDRVR